MRGGKIFLLFFAACMSCTWLSLPGKSFKRQDSYTAQVTVKHFPEPKYDLRSSASSRSGFELGRRLFYDALLSGDSTVSCADCHRQESAFSDAGQSLSKGSGGRLGFRNAPALQNLMWMETFMWDGGVNHPEVQALAPLTGHAEMDVSLERIIARLKRSDAYRGMFRKVYGDTLIDSERLLKGLLQFTGRLVSASSAYDRYLKGEALLKDSEERGRVLFSTKCSSCHAGALLADNGYARNMVAKGPSSDSGRYRITLHPEDTFRFRVPSLRNIALTAPYMHDGSVRTLEDVLAHYAALDGRSVLYDGRLRSIGRISAADRADIVEFLKTLTDSAFVRDRRFGRPEMR